MMISALLDLSEIFNAEYRYWRIYISIIFLIITWMELNPSLLFWFQIL